MEKLTPSQILNQFRSGEFDKASAIKYLVSFIEGSENPKIRVKGLKKFGQISRRSPEVFKFLENLLISDESALVRAVES